MTSEFLPHADNTSAASGGHTLVEFAFVAASVIFLGSILFDVTMSFFMFYQHQSTLEDAARHIAIKRTICRDTKLPGAPSVTLHVDNPALARKLSEIEKTGSVQMSNVPIPVSFTSENQDISKDVSLLRLEARSRQYCVFCFVPLTPPLTVVGFSKLYC